MANLLTPAAARQIIVGPDGRLTRDGITLLNALLVVSETTVTNQSNITNLTSLTSFEDASMPVNYTPAIEEAATLAAANHSSRDWTDPIQDVLLLDQANAQRVYGPQIEDAFTLAQPDPIHAPADDASVFLAWIDIPRPVPTF